MTLKSQLLAILFFAINFIAINLSNAAEPVIIQENNEQHVAQKDATNILLSEDCIKVNVYRDTKYKLERRSQSVIYIYGSNFIVNCVSKRPIATIPIAKTQANLKWDTPSKRKDGTELKPEEISGYFLYHNGEQIKLGVVNSIVIPDLEKGLHSFYIQTVDKNGLVF